MSKFDLPVEAVQTARERWLYFFRHGASLDPDRLPATLDVPVIRQAVEVLVQISQKELDHQRYLEQQRIERDAANLVAAARAAEENARTARQVGFDQGKVIGRIQLLQQLLAQPEIASDELEQLSEQALEQLEESLKRQLSGPKPANGSSPTDKT